MKVTELWSTSRKPTVSFELFPPRSHKGAEKLGNTIDALAGLGPDFVSVTFGAGGSTREGSKGQKPHINIKNDYAHSQN